jgi:hypothetical protein
MPNVFGQDVTSVDEILACVRRHGDALRGTYRARYVFDERTVDPYSGVALERPAPLVGNPPGVAYPWEQVFLAAAACAGSDYPMLAGHLGVPLTRVAFTVAGVFDPRGEFDGLDGYHAPADAAPCYLSLHLEATLTSPAPEAELAAIHRRVIERNMVLGALRGIPCTDALRIERPPARGADAPRAATPPAPREAGCTTPSPQP